MVGSRGRDLARVDGEGTDVTISFGEQQLLCVGGITHPNGQ